MKLIKQLLKYLKGLFIKPKKVKSKTNKTNRRSRSTYHRIRISKMVKRMR